MDHIFAKITQDLTKFNLGDEEVREKHRFLHQIDNH